VTTSSGEHQDEVRDALNAIIADPAYGIEALSSSQTMSNLLKDYLPSAPRERGVLVAAAEAGLAQSLADRVAQGMDVATAESLAASELAAQAPFTPEACRWVVAELSSVLGLRPTGGGGGALADGPTVPPVGAAMGPPPGAIGPPPGTTAPPGMTGPPGTTNPPGATAPPAGAATAPPAGAATYPPPYPGGYVGNAAETRPAPGMPAGAWSPAGQPTQRRRRKWPIVAAAGGVVVVLVVVLAVIGALVGPPKHHSSAPKPTPVTALTAMMSPLTAGSSPVLIDCHQAPLKGLTGVTADAACLGATSTGAVDGIKFEAYQFKTVADYKSGLAYVDNFFGYTAAGSSVGCAKSTNTTCHAQWWEDPHYPRAANQIFQEVYTVNSSGFHPTDIWSIPDQRVVFAAQDSTTDSTIPDTYAWWQALPNLGCKLHCG
jgi:hypothetical protein